MTAYRWIYPLDSERACLSEVGGKGANLARLARAGFPVPGGFLLRTAAYAEYVRSNRLVEPVEAALAGSDLADAAALEDASAVIRGAFAAGVMPAELAAELARAYWTMGAPTVAVRSSATAEDLPDLSFAGQQDTYLNVCGEADLLRAVIACWSSLWTARAIGYRARSGTPHADVSLAVVVQRMVESQASGVLFTANPLSGKRFETVIDAAYGLGEALVSGQVEPDQYVVDMRAGSIIQKTLGAKALSLHGRAGGGTQQLQEDRRQRQALPDERILALAQMGEQVQALFGAPQDIEWAAVDGVLHLLQSRPITSLYPAPVGPPYPLRAYFSFAAVQGMLDPFTPLGREMLYWAFSNSARLFGIQYRRIQDCVWKEAGERLWVDCTPLMRNSVGRRLLRGALGYIEPTIQQALDRVWDEPDLSPARRGVSMKALGQILRFYLPVMRLFIANMRAPEKQRRKITGMAEGILASVRADTARLSGTPRQKLGQFRSIMHRLEPAVPPTLRAFVSLIAVSMASYNFVRLLSKAARAAPGETQLDDLLLALTRGLPHNPTTQMDLDLWQAARAIRSDPALLAEFSGREASDLSAAWRTGSLSPDSAALIGRFLERYGGRGLAEIDLGRARWSEDPAHVFAALAGYLQIERPEAAPDVVFGRGTAQAAAALEEIVSRLQTRRGSRLRVRLVRFFTGRMRALMGCREEPKFFVVRLMAELRQALLAIGAEMVRAGELSRTDDLFYLTWDEIDAYANGTGGIDRAAVGQRRQSYQRELRRRQIPRLLLSDGRAFYEGLADTGGSGDGLRGSPVSPGRVEGRVRVVLDPHHANLQPGEILVCPGTDPSWTPLFLTAGGLIMEVGGLMTHGAVVAREYGIPAIVGVDRATTRLQTGQLICMDGSSGWVERLDDSLAGGG